jgi:hypothetical protein
MEPSGGNQWQPVANATAAETAKASGSATARNPGKLPSFDGKEGGSTASSPKGTHVERPEVIVAISRMHVLIALAVGYGCSDDDVATRKCADSTVTSATARTMRSQVSGWRMSLLARWRRLVRGSSRSRGRPFLRLRPRGIAASPMLTKTVSWGQVLGTGSRFLGEAQGVSRKGCDGQKN